MDLRRTSDSGRVGGYSIAKSGKLHALMLASGDLLALGLSYVIAFSFAMLAQDASVIQEAILEAGRWGMLADLGRFYQFLVASILAVSLFWAFGHYTRRRPFWDELHDTTKLLLIFACLEATITFLGGWRLPRVWLMGTWGMAIVLIPLSRYLIKSVLMDMGWWARPTVIIGTGQNARDTAEAIDGEPALGFRVEAFLVPPPAWGRGGGGSGAGVSSIAIRGRSVPVRRLGENPEMVLRELGSPHIVVALESDDLWEVSKLLLGKKLPYSSLHIVPSIRGLPLVGMDMLHLFRQEVMMLRVQNNLARHIPQRIKRAFDFVGALALLMLLAPLLLLLMIAIRMSGPGVFFGHGRIGKNGKPFKCYKFRTMVPNAQQVLKDLLERDPLARAEWDRDFKLRKDPRVTRVGAFLRRTSLDELPQLWNVLRGNMSLVGPRPVTEDELTRYGDKIDFFLEAKPGITGLWQVSGRNDVSYEERVRLDAWYARNWQLWFDLVILMKTVNVVFSGRSAY
jgi:Undecaprenyl-phosphate galactose phosphotransferase WbaP